MLSDKIILYDDSCPMCSLYTQAFVRLRLLEPQNRVGLAEAGQQYLARLDMDRARHEIPLLDRETGEVVYGIDALFLIISHRFPLLHYLFRLRLFRGSMYGLYQIITYNRRFIAGTAAPCSGFNCAPDFSLKYRSIYLALALIIWAGLLLSFLRNPMVLDDPTLRGAFLMAGGLQLLALACGARARRKWDYLSSVATNVLVFGLLLLPMLILPLPTATLGAILVCAIVFTSLDYGRRLRNLAL
jgi:predicted DCC family thiol-disulfide oxidoreductase YuxK